MEELKNQNSLLLQLVSGLQSQINSKNRQNQILFQQYDQVSQENNTLRAQIENNRNKLKQYQRQPNKKLIQQEESKQTQEVEHNQLKKQLSQRNRLIQKLKLELEQKGGTIVMLESQLIEAREQLANNIELLKDQQEKQNNPKEDSSAFEQRIKQLQEYLEMKSNTVNELTQYMEEQSQKINQLTSESIKTINNYEEKLEEKNKQLQEIERKLKTVSEKKAQGNLENNENVKNKQDNKEDFSQVVNKESYAKQQNIDSEIDEVKSLENKIVFLQKTIKSKVQECVNFRQTIKELQESLDMKQNTLSELTQYMNEQSQKINQLTSESIKTINNYEEKLEEKDKQLQEIQRQLRQINQVKVKVEIENQRVDKQNEDYLQKQNSSAFGPNQQEKTSQIPVLNNKPQNQMVQNNIFSETHQANQMLEIKIKDLQSIIASKEQSLMELSQFLQSQSQKMAELEEKLQNGKIESLEEQISRLNQIITNKDQSLTELGQFLTEMTSKCFDYTQKIEQIESQKETNKIQWEKQKQELMSKIFSAEKAKPKDYKKQVQQISSQEFFLQSEQQISEDRVKLSTKEDQLTHLKVLLKEKDTELSQARSQIARLKIANSQLDAQVAEMTAIVQNRQTNLAQMRQYLNEKLHGDNSAQKQGDSPRKQVEQNKINAAQISELKEKIEELEIIIKSKEQSYSEMAEFLQQSYKQIANLEEQKAAMETEIASLKEMMKPKNDSSVNINMESDPSQSEYTEQLIVKSIEFPLMNQENNKSESEISNTLQIIQQLRNRNNENQRQIQKLKDMLKEKQEVQKDYDSMIESKTQTIAELSQYMNEQANRVSELQELVHKYESGQLNIQKEAHHMRLSSSDKGSDKRQNRGQQLYETISKLEQQLTQKNKIIFKLQENLESKEAKIDELKSSTDLKKYDKQVNEYEDELRQSSISNTNQLVQVIQTQDSTINILRQQIENVTSNLDKLRSEIDQLIVKNQSLKEQIKQLKAKQQDKGIIINLDAPRLSHGSKHSQSKGQQQLLRQKILDLEETIAAKDNTIQELSEFMNDQAVRLAEFEAQQGIKNDGDDYTEKVNEKQIMIQQLTQSVADLQKQLKKSKEVISEDKASRPQTQEEQIEAEGRQMAEDLDIILTEKTSTLENLIKQTEQVQHQMQQILEQKVQLQKLLSITEIDYNEMLRKKQHTLTHIEELQLKAKQLLGQIASHENEDDRADINTMTNVLEHLQQEIRAKDEVIESMEEQIKKLRQGNLSPSSLLPPKRMKKMSQGSDLPDDKQKKIHQLEKEVKTRQERQEQLIKQLEYQRQRFYLEQKQQNLSLEEHENQYQKKTRSLKHSQKNGRQWLPSQQQSEHFFSQISSGIGLERDEKVSTAELLSQLMMYSDDETNEKAIKVLVKALSQKYRQQLNDYQNQTGQLKDTMESLLEQNANLQAQMLRVSLEVKEKNEIIEELQEINEENTKSYHCKLEQIRQSISMFGDEIPSRVIEIISQKTQDKKKRFRHTLDVEPAYQFGLPHKFKSTKKIRQHDEYSVKMVEEVSELREQIQKLRDESERKDKELHVLRKSSNNNQYALQIEGLLEDNNNDSGKLLEKKNQELQNEKQRLLDKCHELEQKLIAAITQCEQQDELIETLNKRLIQKPVQVEIVSQKVQNNQNFNDTTTKILEEMENNRKPYRDSEVEVSRKENQFCEAPHSHDQLEMRLIQKNQIIFELENTILSLEKGYNNEIMGLRRNIAELDAEIINLRKNLYIADPQAIDIADLIRDTCSQNGNINYYKPQFKSRMQPYLQPSPSSQNLSYYTEGRRTGKKRYDPSQLNLGQKMMGRPCRGNYQNFTVNNEFKLNQSEWDAGQMPHM